MTIEELKKLKKQAEQLVPWNVNSAWDGELGTAVIGYTDEDDNQYEIAVFDTTMYDGYEDDSIKLAEFFAAANPATVLVLIAGIERLRERLIKANASAEHFEREWYLATDELAQERKRLDWALANEAVYYRWGGVWRLCFTPENGSCGDDIDTYRSVWICTRCEKVEYRYKLFYPEQNK